MKKIIFIIPLLSSFKLFINDIAQKLNKKGVKVILITNNESQETLENIKIHHLKLPRGLNILSYFKCALHIRKILLKEQPHIVHAHFTTAILATRLSGVIHHYKSFAMCHGLMFNSRSSNIKKYIFKAIEYFAYKPYDVLYMLNEQDIKDTKKKFKNVKKITKFGLGCNVQRFSKKHVKPELMHHIKKELSISDQDIVLIYVGRYVDFKGYDIVIKTFIKLSESNKHIKLLTLGSEDILHPTGLSDLETDQKNKNINIIDIGFTKDVQNYLAISDLMFFPSQKEGMPVNMLEATAMEIPIITYNSRGCNEIVINNYNGIVVKDLEINSYVKAVQHLLNSPQLMKIYKENQARLKEEVTREIYIKNQILDYGL